MLNFWLNPIKIGDFVLSKEDDVIMCVESVNLEKKECFCFWFDDKIKLNKKSFSFLNLFKMKSF